MGLFSLWLSGTVSSICFMDVYYQASIWSFVGRIIRQIYKRCARKDGGAKRNGTRERKEKEKSSMTDLLKVCNFSFSYDESEPPILHDITFSIEKGENLLLLGPSGSGKSSLALCINGLFPRSIGGISTGDISLLGKNIDEY